MNTLNTSAAREVFGKSVKNAPSITKQINRQNEQNIQDDNSKKEGSIISLQKKR